MIPKFTYKTEYGSPRSEIDAVNWAIHHNDIFKGRIATKNLPRIFRWSNVAFGIWERSFIESSFELKKSLPGVPDLKVTILSILAKMGYASRRFNTDSIIIIGKRPEKIYTDVVIFPDSDHDWQGKNEIIPKLAEQVSCVKKQANIDLLKKHIQAIEKNESVTGNEYNIFRTERYVISMKEILRKCFDKAKTPAWEHHSSKEKLKTLLIFAQNVVDEE